MTVKFQRTKPRLWAGNGFGYNPAEYAIVVNGVAVGNVWHSVTEWRATLDSGEVIRSYVGSLADLKREIRKHFA